jgi:outer membrane receptor for ferrienterochelin and colicins
MGTLVPGPVRTMSTDLPALLLRSLLHLCAMALALGSAAQLPVQVNDAHTRAGVPYAHVAWQPLAGGPGAMAVSGPDGLVTLPLDEALAMKGVLLRVSFVGYHAQVDTVFGLAPRTYALERALVSLNEMVVTGQYAPNTPERAVHKVRVLDAAQFQRMAANSLADGLRNELNIRLQQDNILGSSLSMQGMGGENVKILIDGVPVIGRLDGNIDLAQLDLSGIERVEIIEGPLSVSYGTNALAGTINLITRKGGGAPATLKAVSYAEHIGRLNTTLTATRHFGNNDIVFTAGRNFFGGWDPAQPGFPDLSPAPADASRFQQWKPREQFFGRLNYRWNSQRWSFGYKGEAMHDRIINRGRPRPPYFETAFDEQYLTLRLDNAVFAEGRLGNGRRLNALAAHNAFTRTRNTWFRDLTTLGEQLADIAGMQDTSRFTLTNLRAVYSASPDSARIGYELGMDINLETGSGERMADGMQEIGDLAVFASMEYRPSDRVTLRPGLRYAYNTRYGAPLIPSLNLRWQVGDRFTLRASYAQGFRAPSLKELFFFFVDVNHDIVGNPDLVAERSNNFAGGLTYRHAREKVVYLSEISLFHNRISDLITLAQINGARYSYINVGDFRTTGGTLGASWDNGHWLVSVGGGVTGRFDAIAAERGEPWLWSPEMRGGLTRNWMRSGWTASVFWKYQGELANYAYLSDTEITRSFIAPFSMADVNVGKRIWGKRLLLSAGCKDLFDVQNVEAAIAGGIHSGGGASVPMTTGRTYFMRLELDLQRKQP